MSLADHVTSVRKCLERVVACLGFDFKIRFVL